MNSLDLSKVNVVSPYTVWCSGEDYHFITDNDILYVVNFEKDENIEFGAYWFNLTNIKNKKCTNDYKLQLDVICIIEEFLNKNPDILLYICDSANRQQAMRSRLFLRWFNSFREKENFIIRTALLLDDDEENYIAMIVQRDNPDIDSILEYFENEIGMFRENKP